MSRSALGASERVEVRRFRSALTLEPGFSFHVIVTDSHQVLDQALTDLGLPVELVRPTVPRVVDAHEHAEQILRSLDDALEHAEGRPVVLDAIISTPSTDLAWHRVFQRLNELRNFTESRSSGPLIFCVPHHLETALGHEAPDLWSKRGSGMRLSDRTPNRVFVSYSHESDEHAAAVERMAEALVEAGLSVFLDRWHEALPQGWAASIEQQVHDADSILCVCTPVYRARLDGEAPPGSGTGATWEASTIRVDAGELGATSERFKVVQLEESVLAIPRVLGGERARVFRWSEDREPLLAVLRATTARTRLLRSLDRTFGDDDAAMERWASEFLTMTRAKPPSPDRQRIEIVDRLLRLRDPNARVEALASLAMLLGKDRASVDAIANDLGLDELPRSHRRHSPIPPSPSPVSEVEIERYLAEVTSRHREIPLAGFQTKVRIRLSLEDLYVPLDAVVHRGQRSREVYGSAEVAAEHTRDEGQGAHEEIALANAFVRVRALGRRGLILLGDPGSGKTTHLKQVLLKVARDGPESIGLPRGLIPVFLPLRILRGQQGDLWDFLGRELVQMSLDVSPGFDVRLLARGGLLLLLDGLDEVADAEERVRVSRWIEQARRSAPDSYFLVSCRYAGYTRDVELEAAFLEMHLRPLDDKQMRSFVTNWYSVVERTVHGDPQQAAAEATRRAEDLLGALSHRDFTAVSRVYEMTRNPLLLTAICLVHRDRGRLPRARAKLYEECIGVMLERWRQRLSDAPLFVDQAARVLRPVAHWMHEERGRTRATADELREPVQRGLSTLRGVDVDAEGFLRAIRDESGLLTGWGIDEYGFMHLGFQEFLAAQHLRNEGLKKREVLRKLAKRFGDSWWQEVILLMLALDNPSVFEELMREVVQQPEFPRWAESETMTLALAEAAEPSAAPFMDLLTSPGEHGRDVRTAQQLAATQLLVRALPQQAGELAEVLQEHPSAALRQWWRVRQSREAGSAEVILAPRGGVELVRIPGGRFMMGSPEDEKGHRDQEGPQHDVELASFYLAKTPVTNAQYAEYMRANPEVREPRFWAERRYNQPEQPVVGVSWNDAKAYCDWAGLLLPTEAQWEYVCRAGTTTRYHSGNSEEDLGRVGWYSGNSGARLHAVGGKEPNAFGLYDMHGNVWEWCLDDYGSYATSPRPKDGLRHEPEGDAIRVMRGGSWLVDADNARSAFRIYEHPGVRVSDLGVRPAQAHP